MEQTISRARASWITLCGLLQFLFPAPPAQGGQPALSAQSTSGAAPPVLIVHGIYYSAKSMRWMKQFLESHGRLVYAITLTPDDASVSFEVMARQLHAFVKATFPAGEKFDIVAFSMGGLVSRYYIQKLGGAEHVRRFVTLSTPNHGTIWAWLSGRSGVKEMRPGSEMLRELNRDADKLVPLGYTSIYTPLDLTIVPSSSSRMPVGRNVVIWVPLHPLMVRMPGPLRAVERALE